MKLIEFIVRLLYLWENYKRKKKEAKLDADIKALRDNPTKWFNDHFSGVRGDLPDKADDASETDTKPD
tara:strand:- start:3648 stop:3851 length:204 start_codon:yes stop_codon:yes gene_type:complete